MSEYSYRPSKDEYFLPDGTTALGRRVAEKLHGNFASDHAVIQAIRDVAAEAVPTVVNNLSIAQNRTTYQYDGADKTLLESFPNPMTGPGYGAVNISVPEFTSLCPMTGQPDFANIKIEYRPKDKCVESKALKLYLGSFRQHGEFHEACVQRIARDLIEILDPKTMHVIGEFTPRGGIPFWPNVSYTRPKYMLEFKKAPKVSLNGLNTFRKGDKWAARVGQLENSLVTDFDEELVGLVYEGKFAGTATVVKADYGTLGAMMKIHRQMNYEPDQVGQSLECAYGHSEVSDLFTVLYLDKVKMFSGDS